MGKSQLDSIPFRSASYILVCIILEFIFLEANAVEIRLYSFIQKLIYQIFSEYLPYAKSVVERERGFRKA